MTRHEFYTVRTDGWKQARELGRRLTLWRFRGQSDASWPLQTAVERTARRHGTRESLLLAESEVLEEFMRRARFFPGAPASEHDRLEWLALLQHYGCPTRLLDFSHSFYVAAFFAVEDTSADASIWAINYEAISAALAKHLRYRQNHHSYYGLNARKVEMVNSLIGGGRFHPKSRETVANARPLVVDVEPRNLNDRLSVQRGIFLFPCDLQATFMHNLAVTFDVTKEALEAAFTTEVSATQLIESGALSSAKMLKIILPYPHTIEAVHDLRDMNITAATLFPGLDGYARSLKLQFQRSSDGEPPSNFDDA